MAYPSVISTLSNPQPTDRLNSPSHSSLHQAENTAIGEIETFVGTLSSTQGTLVYDIRSPLSNGGGHVQTANKGGTGQTSYNKGDILVASSSSVLTKLAASPSVGAVLTADPSQAVGLYWGAAQASTKIKTSPSLVSVSNGLSSVQTVYFAASIFSSTFGTSNAVRFTGNINTFTKNNSSQWNASVVLGNNYLGNINYPNVNGNTSITAASGVIDGMIIGNGVSSQLSVFKMTLFQPTNGGQQLDNRLLGGFAYVSGVSSVESGISQDLVIKGSFQGTPVTGNQIITDIMVVEQIK